MLYRKSSDSWVYAANSLYGSSLVFRHSSFVTRLSSLVFRHSSLVIRLSSFVTRHSSFIIRNFLSHKPTPRYNRQGIIPETGEMRICLPVSIKICLSYIKLLIVVSSIACIHTPAHIDFVRRKSSVYITVHEVQHTNAITQKVTLS